ELAMVSVEEAIQPLRVRVTRILTDGDFGAFALEAGAGPRANLFVAREWLAERLQVAGRANRVFLAARASPEPPPGSPFTFAPAPPLGREAWELEDVGLSWRSSDGCRELVSDQIFLGDALVDAVRGLEPPA